MKALLLFLAFWAGASAGLAQENYTITTPYDFPVKPGTQAWAELRGEIEKVLACELPVGIAKKMTTDALIQTCMAYPRYGHAVLFRHGIYGDAALEPYFNNFYGFKELATRADAPARLLAYYRNYIETVGGTNQFFEQSFSEYIDCLLMWPVIYSKFTDVQKEEFALLTWRLAVRLFHHPKYSQGCILPVKRGLDLLIKKGIVIHHHGQILDKTILPPGAIKFCTGDASIPKADGNWVADLIALVKPFVK